jgi:hypothetical protein
MAVLAPEHQTEALLAGRAALRTFAVTAIAGGVSGFLAGGIGGRLAMRLLALTSPDIAQGRLTDDAARVGAFTLGGSFGLALALGMAGAILGMGYLLVRRVLPESRTARIARTTLLTASVGGAVLIHDHPSFDYSILAPAWLAVVLFIGIPGLYGAALAFLVERYVAPDPPRFPGPMSRLWHARAVTRLGSAAYWIVVAWGVYNIGADVASLVSDSASSAPFTV